ncbi:hypothetical protein [Actinoallomurus soli]|uniref:hypothetical protein n=1 Tax=Actinoallomurus soli TaxID=2952535 RepID=UPI002093E09A|nr:hypothetical protein [Actinoallomurus soli]MCO5970107.1 hypothetical protein [Actinoallomurus soli]
MRLSRLGRSISIVSGVIALASVIGSSPGAMATTPTWTQIVLAPIQEITYGDSTVTIHGTLETRSSTPGDARPIAGKAIDVGLQNDGPPKDLGTVTTGDDGTFSLTATLPEPGMVVATYAGDADYGQTKSGRTARPAAHLPARVTLHPMPATAIAYSSVPVTGTVEMQTPDGRWIPAPDTVIGMDSDGVRQWIGPSVHTDDSGAFRTSALMTSPGPWTAVVQANDASFAGNASSSGQTIDVSPAPVQISDFSATYSGRPVRSVAAAQGLAFSATVSPYVGGQTAELYFQPRGSKAWSLMGSYPVERFGTVTVSGISGYVAKGRPREGSWQLRTAATPLLQAATTPALPVEVYLSTSFHSLKIKKVHGKAYLQGVLSSANGPLAGQKLDLEYRYRSKTAEHHAAYVKTGKGGVFSVRLPATHRYYRVLTTKLPQDYDGVISSELYFSH